MMLMQDSRTSKCPGKAWTFLAVKDLPAPQNYLSAIFDCPFVPHLNP